MDAKWILREKSRLFKCTLMRPERSKLEREKGTLINRFQIMKNESTDHLKQSKLLELGSNKIKKIAQHEIKALKNISCHSQLEEFWCNDNQISNWDDLKCLMSLKVLETTVDLGRIQYGKAPQNHRESTPITGARLQCWNKDSRGL